MFVSSIRVKRYINNPAHGSVHFLGRDKSIDTKPQVSAQNKLTLQQVESYPFIALLEQIDDERLETLRKSKLDKRSDKYPKNVADLLKPGFSLLAEQARKGKTIQLLYNTGSKNIFKNPDMVSEGNEFLRKRDCPLLSPIQWLAVRLRLIEEFHDVLYIPPQKGLMFSIQKKESQRKSFYFQMWDSIVKLTHEVGQNKHFPQVELFLKHFFNFYNANVSDPLSQANLTIARDFYNRLMEKGILSTPDQAKWNHSRQNKTGSRWKEARFFTSNHSVDHS